MNFMALNPLFLDLPIPIKTPRLILRPPHVKDAPVVNEAILESFDRLSKWLDWADHRPTLEETEENLQIMYSRWLSREDLPFCIFDRITGNYIGETGLHKIDWSLPRCEIGYWVRTSYSGKGIAIESTHALLLYALKELNAVRVEIKCDEDNIKSRRIPEALSFVEEGILRRHRRKLQSAALANTVIYARYDADKLPPLDVIW